jgi:hypothetical protein
VNGFLPLCGEEDSSLSQANEEAAEEDEEKNINAGHLDGWGHGLG